MKEAEARWSLVAIACWLAGHAHYHVAIFSRTDDDDACILDDEWTVMDARKYLTNFLSLGVRTDGRLPEQVRPLSVNVGCITCADGSSLLRCGDTIVMCGVKLELVSSIDLNAGYLVCNVECGSTCLPESTSGAPSSHTQGLTKQLQILLDKYIDVELLALKESQVVWVVYVDVVCLSHHGNLLDACTLAAMAALQNTKMPSISLDLNLPKMKFPANTRLPLTTPSFTVSFALFSNWCLLDPTHEEERNAQGLLSIGINGDGALTLFQHTGHTVTEQEILRLSLLAMNQVTSFNKLLKTSQNIGM